VISAGPQLFRLKPPPIPGLMPMKSRRHTLLGALTVVGTVLLTLAAGELLLRVVDFRYELRVHIIESTAPEAEEVHRGYSIDPHLVWVDNGYYDRLNDAKTKRIDIAFMGDSCTQFGSYDRLLAALIEANTGGALSIVKLGVAGWTTHQGMRQMERDVAALRPKIVTICFGWNDHWLSIGLSDMEVERINRSVLGRMQWLRLGQLVTKAYVALAREKDRPVARVDEREFHDHLVDMVKEAKRIGAVPVLITAPSSHVEGHEPAFLAGRWVADLSDLVPTHRRYADIVRQVAVQQGVVLCDLAAAFESLEGGGGRGACFYADGIHYTEEGNVCAARFLFDCFENNEPTRSVFR